jgi:hypothetical protein
MRQSSRSASDLSECHKIAPDRWGCGYEHLQRSTFIDFRAHVLRGDGGDVRQRRGPSEGQITVPGGHLATWGRHRCWLSSGYHGGELVPVPHASDSRVSCKIWHLISRTMSEATRIAATTMIARSAPSPSSPAPSARRYAALGLDRSARRANPATVPPMRCSYAATRLSDNVGQIECWFSHVSLIPESPSLPLNHNQLTRKECLRIAFRCPTFHTP